MTDSNTVFQLLNKVKSEVGSVGKNQRNDAQKFNFRGVDDVVNAAAPELNKFGVITTPKVLSYTYDTIEVGQYNKKMAHVVLEVEYTFWGPSGDHVTTSVLAESMDSGDKGCPKAMSVAYRIALLQVLNLPTTDRDPDADSYERSGGTLPAAQTAGKRPSPPRASKLNWVYTGANKADSEIDWKLTIDGAKSRDELNEAFKKAGELGVLPNVKDMLYKKADDLDTSKSAS